MDRRTQALLAGGLAVAAIGVWLWVSGPSPIERRIRGRIDELATIFNAPAPAGPAAVGHALRIVQFFTEDVIVELGCGTPPIQGRDTVMGMATRLQPRTAGFLVAFDDVAVVQADEDHAEVTMTAVIRERGAAGREAFDARELAASLRRTDGEWRVSRVVAVDTLR